jgi:tRNA-dihydrouridine synthase 3
VINKGAGSALLCKPAKIESICRAVAPLLRCPLTLKMRTGYADDVSARVAHTLAPQLAGWGASALTLHGRSRAQRYTRTADWAYIAHVGALSADTALQLVGNGDVMGWSDYEEHLAAGGVATCMLARGALVKPWLFTEIKERRDWDISSSERFSLLQRFASHGLEHWGSDGKGVETTRRFLLEWLSFLHRYIPVGLLERLPQRLNLQPPAFVGRDAMETLMASTAPEDWVRLTTMLLGPTPEGFRFEAKHKSNAYAASSEAGAALYDANTNG